MRVAVIGGGPAGLVTLKYLLQAHQYLGVDKIEAVLFETESAIGGTFRYRSYERAELVSSRHLTLFSDFRLPDDSPDFITTERYCAYLEEYCTHFELWPSIRLSTLVKRVQRGEKHAHQVYFQTAGSTTEETWHCDAVAVCSGLHVTPNIPRLRGIEKVPYVIHSSNFSKCTQFGANKNVVVLGAGETSMDLAYLAVTSPTASVTLCHRSGWQNAPKRFPEPIKNGDMQRYHDELAKYGPMPPTDCGSPSLFDTAYVHPWLENSGYLWGYYDLFVRYSSWFISGTTAGLDQWIGDIPQERFHARKVVPNKSNNATPYLSAPYKPKVQTKGESIRSQRVSLPPLDLKGRHIELAPWPDHIDDEGYIHFQDTGRPESEGMKHVKLKPDVVVFATGYTQTFPFLDGSYPRPETADNRRIWNSSQPDISFIGFTRPNFGAIPPLAELQAQLWILNLHHRLGPLANDTSYRLQIPPDRRLQYIVDHDTYAYRLALDMSSAPSLFTILLKSLYTFNPRLLGACTLGPNFGTKFRLTGPWAYPGASDILSNELWRVIARRRGWFVWTFLTIIPLSIFGPLSLACWIVDTLTKPVRVVFEGLRVMVRYGQRGLGMRDDVAEKRSSSSER